MALYARSQVGARPPAPLPLRYSDYAAWQRSALTTEALSDDLDYWKQQLADLSPLQLPTIIHAGDADFDGTAQVFTLSNQRIGTPQGAGPHEGASDYMALLGAFKVLLSIYACQTDIAVGTSNGNRGRVELEALWGSSSTRRSCARTCQATRASRSAAACIEV